MNGCDRCGRPGLVYRLALTHRKPAHGLSEWTLCPVCFEDFRSFLDYAMPARPPIRTYARCPYTPPEQLPQTALEDPVIAAELARRAGAWAAAAGGQP
jgi:hypothetical protein